MNKKERLEKIRRFVTDYQIGTQEEIVEHLREAGISATQATVSRDIKELGIVKIPLKDQSTGRNYNTNRFGASIRKYLKSLGLESGIDIKGNTIYVTIK